MELDTVIAEPHGRLGPCAEGLDDRVDLLLCHALADLLAGLDVAGRADESEFRPVSYFAARHVDGAVFQPDMPELGDGEAAGRVNGPGHLAPGRQCNLAVEAAHHHVIARRDVVDIDPFGHDEAGTP